MTKKVKEYYQHIKSKLTKNRKLLLLVILVLFLIIVFVGYASYSVYQKSLKPSESNVQGKHLNGQVEFGSGVSLNYDEKKWTVSNRVSSMGNEYYFSYRPYENRDDPDPRLGYSEAKIFIGNACSPDSPVKKFAQSEFKSVLEHFQNMNQQIIDDWGLNLEIIDDFSVVNINGLDYYYFKYKITDTNNVFKYKITDANLGETYYRQVYVAEISDKQNDCPFLYVELTSTDEDSESSVELKNLLNNITVKNRVKSH